MEETKPAASPPYLHWVALGCLLAPLYVALLAGAIGLALRALLWIRPL